MPQASQAAKAASSFTSTIAVTASVLVWGRHCDVTLSLPVTFQTRHSCIGVTPRYGAPVLVRLRR